MPIQSNANDLQSAAALVKLMRWGLGESLVPGTTWDGVDWRAVQTLTLHQGIAPWLYFALKTRGALVHLPADFATHLQKAFYHAVASAEFRHRATARVLSALAEDGLVPVVLKGEVLAQEAYPEPACRPMGDLDLWFTDRDLERARQVLERIGYTRKDKTDRPSDLQKRNLGEVQLFAPKPTGDLVELHWGVFPGEWARRTMHVNEAEIRQRTVALTLNGQTIHTLAPEDTLLGLAFHWAITHQLGAPGLRALLDIILYTRIHPIRWDVVATRARAWRIATVVYTVMNLAWDLDGSPHVSAIMRLVGASPRRWWLRRRIRLDLIARPQGMMRGAVRFIYLLMMIDRPVDCARMFLRALLPESDWLIARYGKASWSVQMTHLWNALQGRV